MSANEEDRETAESAGGDHLAENGGRAESPAKRQPGANHAEQPDAEHTEQPDARDAEQPEPKDAEQPEPEAEQAPEPTARQEGEPTAEAATGEESVAQAPEPPQEPAPGGRSEEEDDGDADEQTPRAKPAVPGAHLEVDIVPEGVDPLGRGEGYEDLYAVEEDQAVEQTEEGREPEQEPALPEPIATAAIDLAAGARYRATGKRKTAVARVTLRPGSGVYLINGRALEVHFPRLTLQRNIRQPLETVGYQERMDVVARLGGGGISAQAGALRHGVSRALLEADPNLRGELKRRGFLTRDSRVKERKKAGLKKARKRPQFSKR
jgi:small subunit ribosomal protein S9